MKKIVSDQRGFTLIEVLVTVTVLGILAAIAIPRFDNATALANTAKIQSDLQTLDSAIIMYQMENGGNPSGLSDLSSYLNGDVTPPKGKCFMQSATSTSIPTNNGYTINTTSNRAQLGDGNTIDKFGKTSS